jgi:hypothetical protein
MTSGEAEEDLRQVVHEPIPPKGLNLNFPLSDAMRSCTRRPTTRHSSKSAGCGQRVAGGEIPGSPNLNRGDHGLQLELEVFLQPSATGEGTYLTWLLEGLQVDGDCCPCRAWVIALVIGSSSGCCAPCPTKWLSGSPPPMSKSSATSRCWCNCSSGTSCCRNCCPSERWATPSSRPEPPGPAVSVGDGLPGLVHRARVCRAGALGHQLPAPRPEERRPRLGFTLPRPIAMCCCRWPSAWSCRR